MLNKNIENHEDQNKIQIEQVEHRVSVVTDDVQCGHQCGQCGQCGQYGHCLLYTSDAADE